MVTRTDDKRCGERSNDLVRSGSYVFARAQWLGFNKLAGPDSLRVPLVAFSS
jgi:hypothetical protein